jgi:monoamine oxidase
MKTSEIIIVGAGAAGLMAARELSKAGKKIIVLEARDRVGGRIFPLSENEFGYAAAGGAEFVHGKARVTKALLKEAGLTYEPTPEDAEMWRFENGKLIRGDSNPAANGEFAANRKLLYKKLQVLKKDLPIAKFLSKNFSGVKYKGMKSWIIRMVEGFDAADPNLISTFSLRDEWLGQQEWEQGRVKEGYKPMLDFLIEECKKNKVRFIFDQQVESVEIADTIKLLVKGKKVYQAEKVILTFPIPILRQMNFNPKLSKKIQAANNIGFGQIIKVLMRFKDSFWPSKMSFLFSSEIVGSWWTQYPKNYKVLTGWISGPRALKLKDKTDAEIIKLAITSLSIIFQIEESKLKQNLLASKVINWPKDPFTKGAYSYSKVKSEAAYTELRSSYRNQVYFVGEAVYLEKQTATVEGALASGLDAAKKILG